MRKFSVEDLELVSGALGPVGVIIGGAAGASYIGNTIATGEGSVAGLVGSVATGAALGFLTGPASMGAMQTAASVILVGTTGFYGGMAGGYVQKAIDAAGTNYNNAAGTNYN